MTANILKHPRQSEPNKMDLLNLEDYVNSVKRSAVTLRLAIAGTKMATQSHADALECAADDLIAELGTISAVIAGLGGRGPKIAITATGPTP